MLPSVHLFFHLPSSPESSGLFPDPLKKGKEAEKKLLMLRNRGAENSCVFLAATRISGAHQLNGLLSVGRASPHADAAEVCTEHF